MSSFTVQFLLALLFVAVLQCSVEAFSVNGGAAHRSSSRIGSSTSLEMTVLSYNGKKKDFKAGSPLSKAVQQLGVKPRYSCKKVRSCFHFRVLSGRNILVSLQG